MKYCTYCGDVLDDDMVYCPKCGKKQVIDIQNQPSYSDTHETEKATNISKKAIPKIILVISGLCVIALSVFATIFILERNTNEKTFTEVIVTELPTVQFTTEPTPEPTPEPYSADYCLTHKEEFTIPRRNIQVSGYVSSTFPYPLLAGGTYFWSFLSYDTRHISGYYLNRDAGSDDEFDIEYSKMYNSRVIMVRPADKNNITVNCKNLIPGSFVILTGKVFTEDDDDYPGQMALVIEVTDVEVVR